MLTGGTAASKEHRGGKELSQRRFASVCDHKTLSGSVSIPGFNGRIELARAANQCLHGLTLVGKSSLERLLNRHSRKQAAYQNQWAIHAWRCGETSWTQARTVRIGSSRQSADKGGAADTTCSWEWNR